MSVESDTAGAHAATEAGPTAPPVANPSLLALITFLPAGICLGLWFIGALDTTALPGGMIPIVAFSAGLFMLISTVSALQVGDSVTAAIFGIFSAFWGSFGVLLFLLNNGMIVNAGATDPAQSALTTAQGGEIQSVYLLSFTLVFIFLTLATLRLPLAFTAGFVFVDITFVLAYIGVTAGATGLFPIAGITTFIFTLIFAYVLFDAFGQTLGGKPMAMGGPIQK